MFLRQSTAATVTIGPFIDLAGTSRETALTLTYDDIRLSKNGGAFASKSASATCAHMYQGFYNCRLVATDTNTLGRVTLTASDSAALAVWHEYLVLPANAYDSLVLGSDYLQVDTEQIGGVAHISATIGTVARVNSVVTGTIGTVGKTSSVTTGTIGTVAKVNSVTTGTIATVGQVTSVVSGTVLVGSMDSGKIGGWSAIFASDTWSWTPDRTTTGGAIDNVAQVSSVVSGTIGKVTSVTAGTIGTVGQVTSVISGTIPTVGQVTSVVSGTIGQVSSVVSGTIGTVAQVSSVVSGTVGVTGNVTTSATSNTAIKTAVLAGTVYNESVNEFTLAGAFTRLLAGQRNKRVVLSGTQVFYKDDGSTPLMTQTLTTVGATFTRGEAT